MTRVQWILMLGFAGICAAVLVPVAHKLYERRTAAQVRAQLEEIDAALRAMEERGAAPAGRQVIFAEVKNFLPAESSLVKAGGRDAAGNRVGPFVIGMKPLVPEPTKAELKDIAGPWFWSPYQ